MTDWPVTPFGEVFEINPRRELKRGVAAAFVPMDALPEHVRSIARIEQREYTGTGTRFRNGDTLLARITPCLENGKTAYVAGLQEGEVAHGSTEYIVISGKPDVTDDLFAYYAVRAPDFRAEAVASMEGTSGRQRVPVEAVARYELALPPVAAQHAISRILGALDDKIEIAYRTSETLGAIAQALFNAWFVNFAPVRAKVDGESIESICERLRLTPEILALFADSFEDSNLGAIPAGWDVTELNAFATLSTLSVSPNVEPDQLFEHYSIPAFDAGRTPSYELGHTIKSNKYRVSPDAVLVSKLNPETPRVWLPDVKTTRAVCSTEFMQFEPRYGYGRTFLYLLLQSEYVQTEIRQRVTGSTGSRQRAQPSQIAALPVLMPGAPLIQAAEAVLEPLLRMVAASMTEAAVLAETRDALLPELLSGRLQVRDVIE